MTAAAALLAHWVLNTKIWLDCCMYCWSIADCCFESTFEGSGWEGGMFMGMCGEEEVGGPGASPMGPGPRGPPAPPSPAKSEEKQGQSVAAESGAVNIDLWHFWSSIKHGRGNGRNFDNTISIDTIPTIDLRWEWWICWRR